MDAVLTAAVFDLVPQSPVLKFWSDGVPFDVYLKLPQAIMFALVAGIFIAAMLIPFQHVEPVPEDEIPEDEQLAAYGRVLHR